MSLPTNMVPKLLSPQLLYETIKAKGSPSSAKIRLLDCSFVLKPRPAPDQFAYARFDQFDPNNTESRALFQSGHIPGATHFDLALATHPTEYEQFANYPAKIFAKYAQMMGLNSEDHLVVYGRGKLGGMLFASRVYWMFKSYGHEGGLSLLDGGFESWSARKLPVEMGDQRPEQQKGNWEAKVEASAWTFSFSQLQALFTGANDTNNTVTLLDARPKAQFEGLESGFDPTKAKPLGCHLPGAINVPSTELIQPESGQLKSSAELRALLSKNGVNIEDGSTNEEGNLVTLCNSGMQASLLATALDVQLGPKLGGKLRVYTGSMLEVQARAPELIKECAK